MTRPRIAVIGAGPAGLMAAQVLAQGGAQVDVYDAMPSVGRKFLLAGRGGLNLTHAEAASDFVKRFDPVQAQARLAPMLANFGQQAVRDWAHSLGVDTFVGTSSRVFPVDMKAAPLLRAWLHRLRQQGVQFHMRHRWQGWQASSGSQEALIFTSPNGPVTVQPDATVLALGGASWSRLGSDGAWVPWLQQQGLRVSPLQAANCGFDVAPAGKADQNEPSESAPGWSEHLQAKFAGLPIKPVALTFTDEQGQRTRQQGEFVLTCTGVEGSLIYAFSARLREAINQHGRVTIELDLLPSHSTEQVASEVRRPKGPRSLSTHLKSRLGISGLKMALLHELLSPAQLNDHTALAHAIKALPVTLLRPRPIDEAISTAGGVHFDGLSDNLMFTARPGVFCAGEMLDWEAPTGGYLLTASLSTGQHAAQGALQWLAANVKTAAS